MNRTEIISSIIQTVTSIVAVVIAITSLVWTTKSQRDANKPYIVAYLKQVLSSSTLITYLVIKNYGKTGAIVTNVTAVPALDCGNLKFENNPFSNFKSQIIAPNQSYAAGISIGRSSSELKTTKFVLTICYLDQQSKKQTETFSLDKDALDTVQHFNSSPTEGDDISRAIYKTSSEDLVSRL